MSPSKDEVTAYKQALALKRHNITLLYSPFTTIVLVVQVVTDYFGHALKSVLTSKSLWFVLVPLVILYGGLTVSESPIVDEVNMWSMFFVWWFGLGVLSSVGLGSGMHSGILFLFPHMFRVVTVSKGCPSMDFVSVCDMWWQECSMKCMSGASAIGEPSFMDCWLRVCVPAFLWGAGTAAGEIPPYAVSRAAALAGEVDDDVPDIKEETEGNDVISQMKAWMIDFVEKYGFWGVLVMSAWPNAAFDLVGICCGQLNIPFMTFFVATLIGKAVIKVNGQAVFFVWWFRNPELVIQSAVSIVESFPKGVLPLTANDVKVKMNEALEQVSKGKSKDGSPSLVKQAGEYLVFSVIAFFAYSCVSQFAQQRQKVLDDALLEQYRITGVKNIKSKTE